MKHTPPALACLMAVFAGPALACEGCATLDPTLDELKPVIATVTAARAYFLPEEESEEAEPLDDGSEPVPRQAYVIKGDELIAFRVDGGRVLAAYINAKGVETVGWLDVSQLRLTQAVPQPAGTFMGTWSAGEWSTITISKGKRADWLVVEGEGYWASSDENYAAGNVNEGGFGGEAPVVNGKLGFTTTEDDSYKPFSDAETGHECAVELELVGTRYLHAVDNEKCGGHNVRFLGYYARSQGN